MAFTRNTYNNFVTEISQAQTRLFNQYKGTNKNFDIIIIGSGMGGGILADDLIDHFVAQNRNDKRILVLEAGSYLYPTHIYNLCRFPNADVAKKFAVDNFSQQNNNDRQSPFIGEKPQLNFGGRSIFWSGLIPKIQEWEQQFFPENIQNDFNQYFDKAEERLNTSKSMGTVAQKIVEELRKDNFLNDNFDIQETPRALHQPYLNEKGEPTEDFFLIPTGVFNTAELLINQLGLANDNQMFNLLLNSFVETIEKRDDGKFNVNTKNLTNEITDTFTAPIVVVAGGSIETPKIIKRSPIFDSLSDSIKPLVGQGLTDHPTTDWLRDEITKIGDVDIPRNSHAKIVFYSQGKRNSNGEILFPFNVEININHEYWHLRENDPTAPAQPIFTSGKSKMELKFSFANCLDSNNKMFFNGSNEYVPQIQFTNLRFTDHLVKRFNKLAGWNKNADQIFDVLNDIAKRIFAQFKDGNTSISLPDSELLGNNNKGFGYGTVHHAIGTMRMPFKDSLNSEFDENFVVDENLMVKGQENLFVCDMSVMPFSSAANPVLTLATLALRLSDNLKKREM